jgi:hypothetical protein
MKCNRSDLERPLSIVPNMCNSHAKHLLNIAKPWFFEDVKNIRGMGMGLP